MKFFALFFAAALLSASLANPVQQQEKTKWEETVEAFWDYVTRVGEMADDATAQIRTSQVSKELDGLITDTIAEVERYTEELNTKLGPTTLELHERLKAEVTTLTENLRNDMEESKGKVVQYARDARLMFDHNLETVKSQFNLFTRKLKKRITKDVDELRQKIRTYTTELQTNTDEKLRAMRENLEPYILDLHEKGQERFDTLHQALGEQGRTVHQQLSRRAQELHGQFQEKIEEIKVIIDEGIDKLHKWLNPILRDITSQYQNMMEQIRQPQ